MSTEDQKYILIDLHKEIVGILKRIDLKLEFLASRDKNDYTSYQMWLDTRDE